MVGLAQARALALALPETADEGEGERLALAVAGKGFAWTYLERFAPRAPRRPRPDVLAVRCELDRKEMLIAAAPDRYFDDEHYRGYPAVLVRLAAIDPAELAALLERAWRLKAPRRLRPAR